MLWYFVKSRIFPPRGPIYADGFEDSDVAAENKRMRNTPLSLLKSTDRIVAVLVNC